MAYNDIVSSSVNIQSGEQYGAPGEGFQIYDEGILNVGYVEDTVVKGGGTVYSATIGYGGSLYVVSGAGVNGGLVLSDITLDGGELWGNRYLIGTSVENGAYVISGLTVNDGSLSTYNGTLVNYVQSSGTASLWKGGISGGTIYDGDVKVYGATVVFNDVVISSGYVNVSSGKTQNVIVRDGEFTMSAGNGTYTASNLIVSGGRVVSLKTNVNLVKPTFVGGNIEITGVTFNKTVTIGGDATLTINDATGVVDTAADYVFDLTECEDGRDVMIDDFSYTNANSYTIKTTATQTGSYSLATVSSFDKQFTLIVGESVNTISVGESLLIGDLAYKLSCDMSDLCLEIGEPEAGTLTITAGSDALQYDGVSHTVNTYSYVGKLVEGDTLQVTVSGATGTDAGTYANKVSTVKVLRSGEDVTDEYDITKVDGSLDISKRSITITTDSAKKIYDGTPLTCDTYTVTGDGFAGDENVSVTVTGTQTEVGSSDNTFNYSFVSGGKAGNYDVTKVMGKLTVVSGYDDIIGSSVNMASPETYGAEGKGFIIASDGEGNKGVLNNGYVDGGTSYTAGLVTSATISAGGELQVINLVTDATVLKDIVIDGGKLVVARKPTGADGSNFYVHGLTLNSGNIVGGWRMIIDDYKQYGGVASFYHNGASGGVISGGTLVVLGGSGCLKDVAVYGGTVSATNGSMFLNNTVYGGTYLMSAGGPTSNFVISGGTAVFLSGAKLYDATLVGGETTISGGATLNKTITVGGSAQVTVAGAFVDTAAKWNFDLSKRTSADAVLIDNMSSSNATSYAVTVAGEQASGIYQLAGNASNLQGRTFSLTVGGSAVAGGITVGGVPVNYNNTTYALAISDKILKLYVGVESPAYSPVFLLKNGKAVTSGASFNSITLGGDVYDAVTILSGGTVTNLTYISGDVSVEDGGLLSGMTVNGGTQQLFIDYEVSDLNLAWSGMSNAKGGNSSFLFKSGAIVHGGTIYTTKNGNAVTVKDGAVLSNITYSGEMSNGLNVEEGGVISGLTILTRGSGGGAFTPTRISGTVVGANITSVTLKTFGSGVVGGVLNFYSAGAVLDLACSTTKVSGGTVNLNSGATMTIAHTDNTAAKHPEITEDSIINVYSGAKFNNRVEADMNGTLNMMGGTAIVRSSVEEVVVSGATTYTTHTAMTMGDNAKLNVYAVDFYNTHVAVSNYGELLGNDTFTITFVVEGENAAEGNYYLMGDASKFSRSVNISVGSNVSAIGLNETVEINGYNYTLCKDNRNQVLVAVVQGDPVILYTSGGVASTAKSVTDTVIDGTTCDRMVIKTGGTATNTTVSAGCKVSMNGGVINGLNISGGDVSLMAGTATAINGTITTISGLFISGMDASNIDVNVLAGDNLSGGGMVVADGTVDHATVHAVLNGLWVSDDASMTNLDLYGFARISGCVSGANVYYDAVNGVAGYLKTFRGGWLDGEINLNSGTRIEIASANDKSAHEEGQILGTVNVSSGAGIYAFHTGNTKAKIGSGAVVNVFEGGRIFQSQTALAIAGTVNLSGGCIINNPYNISGAYTSGAIIDLTDGTLNFDLAGVKGGTEVVYVRDFNNIGGKETFACSVNADSLDYGQYILFGNASTYERAFAFKVNGTVVDAEFNVGESYTDTANKRTYSLVKSGDEDEKVVILKVGTTAYAQSTGAITGSGDVVEGVWGTTTSYSTGAVYAGNTEAEVTRVIIDNDGTVGAGTWVFGGAAGADMAGEADIQLQQGAIGAIMGGAQDAAHRVGEVDIQIGGGDAAATTGVVYGGGFGSVDGDITVATRKNAVVTGQLYGGPMVMSGAQAVVSGGIALNLNGGTLGSDVIGGARVQADTIATTTVGNISIDVSGAVFSGDEVKDKCVYAGGWIVGQAAEASRKDGEVDYSAGSVAISISSNVAAGTANGRGVFGGAFASDYAIAEVGNVAIRVSGATVGNVFGGGWAQKGAQSNVTGTVTINVSNATADSIYGGGAHSNAAEIAGTTSVSGDIAINISNSTVDCVCAVGQAAGDVSGTNSTITVTGNSTISHIYGMGNGKAGKATNTTLALDDFTGTLKSDVANFDNIAFSKNTVANIESDASVEGNSKWTFDLTARTSESAALTWKDGSFKAEEAGDVSFELILGGTATDWVVCDLSGDNKKMDAFENVSFKLGLTEETMVDYTLGYQITIAGWTDKMLVYNDSGKLIFSDYVAPGQLA